MRNVLPKIMGIQIGVHLNNQIGVHLNKNCVEKDQLALTSRLY
jgi:hypothetical protein